MLALRAVQLVFAHVIQKLIASVGTKRATSLLTTSLSAVMWHATKKQLHNDASGDWTSGKLQGLQLANPHPLAPDQNSPFDPFESMWESMYGTPVSVSCCHGKSC